MSEYRPVNLGKKNVNNLVLWCSDHRFQPAFQETTEIRYEIYEADRLVVPAPSKSIVNGALIPWIEMLHSKHSFEDVDIFDHVDCAGYGGLEAFDGVESLEAQAHFKVLRLAKEIIHQAIPNLNIRGHVLGSRHELIMPITEEAPANLRTGD